MDLAAWHRRIAFATLLLYLTRLSSGYYIRRDGGASVRDNDAGRSKESQLNIFKRIVDLRVSYKECNMDEGLREDCGFFGMTEKDCYKRACCWGESETEGVPWCYHSKPTLKPQCGAEVSERLECGYYGIRKEQCLATGCCWKPTNAAGVAWCFHEKRTPAFEGECGVPVVSPMVASRIVGGTEAKAHSWPWQVSVQGHGNHFCGGSLINDRWVISAAHCGPLDTDNTIVIGMHNVNEATGTEPHRRTVGVERSITHDAYSPSNDYDNDIMLIQLSEPIEFGESVQPACLPGEARRVPVGTHCYTTGWGTTSSGGDSPDTLQQVVVPILAEDTCNQEDWYGGRISDNMLCAGYHEGGRDSCQGDSGGPLVCYQDEHWTLYGVVSWGEGCAFEAKPGLYARVSNYILWIEKTIARYS